MKRKLKKVRRYFNGAVFGMMCEYLHRVNTDPIAIGLTILIGTSIVVDIFFKKKK